MGFIGNFTKILEISELSELSHRLGRHQYWPNIYSVIYQFKGNLMDNKVWITSFLKNEIIFFLLFITPPTLGFLRTDSIGIGVRSAFYIVDGIMDS